MLKVKKSTRSAAELKEIKTRIGGNNIIDGSKVMNQKSYIKRKNLAKTIQSKNFIKSKNHDFPTNLKNMKAGTGFFTSEARLAFIKLRQVFVKTPILYHFHPV